MSYLQGDGQQIRSQPRNTGVAAEPSDIRTSVTRLNTPGVVPVAPPADTMASQTAAMLHALTGGVSSALGAVDALGQAARVEVDKAFQKFGPAAQQMGLLGQPNPGFTSDTFLGAYNMGQAQSAAAQDVMDFQNRLTLPTTDKNALRIDPATDVMGQLKGFMAKRLPPNMTPAATQWYAEHFLDQALPIAAQSVAKERDATMSAVAEQLKIALNGATSPEQVSQIMNDPAVPGLLHYKGWTPGEFAKVTALDTAQAAAIDGNPAKLGWFKDHIAPYYPDQWAALSKQADANWVAKASDASRSAVEQALQWNQPAAAVNPDTLRQAVDQHAEEIAQRTGRDPGTVKLALLGDSLTLAATKGDLARVKLIGQILPPSAAAQDATYRAGQAALGSYRDQEAERFTGRFISGQYATGELIDELHQRVGKWMADKNDPQGIEPSKASTLLTALGQHRIETTKLDLQMQDLQALYTNDQTQPHPTAVGSEYDGAIANLWGVLGVAQLRVSPDGKQSTMGAVTNPERAAYLSAKQGRVPQQWADQITAGLTAGSADSARALYALHRLAPNTAAALVATLPADPQARAQQFLKKADDTTGPQVSPPALGQAATQSNAVSPDYTKALQAAWQGTASITKSNLTKSDAEVALYGSSQPSAGKQASAAQAAIYQAFQTNALPELNNSGLSVGHSFLGIRDWLTGTQYLSWAAPDAEVTNYWHAQAVTAYQAQKAQGVNDANARTNATLLASQATLQQYTPTVWNGTVYLDARSHTYPGFERDLKQQITDYASTSGMSAAQFMASYRPRWDDAGVRDPVSGRRVKGWYFVGVQNPDTVAPSGGNGGAFYVVPNDHEQQAVDEWIKTLKDKHAAVLDIHQKNAAGPSPELRNNPDINAWFDAGYGPLRAVYEYQKSHPGKPLPAGWETYGAPSHGLPTITQTQGAMNAH